LGGRQPQVPRQGITMDLPDRIVLEQERRGRKPAEGAATENGPLGATFAPAQVVPDASIAPAPGAVSANNMAYR
jgi:hypothetical protein